MFITNNDKLYRFDYYRCFSIIHDYIYKQILKNAGLAYGSSPDFNLPYDKGKKFNHDGYDVKGGQICDMIKNGIIDHAKVTTCALINAVSVATTILSTNAIVTLARTYEAN